MRSLTFAAVCCAALLSANAALAQHATPGDIADGQRAFGSNCVVCHGPDGNIIPGIDFGRGIYRRDYTDAEWERFLHGPEAKVKTELVNMTYEGLVDKVRSRYLIKDPETLQPALRRAVERVATFTDCPSCGGTRLNAAARSSLIDGKNSAR